jgi:hypothetical protein
MIGTEQIIIFPYQNLARWILIFMIITFCLVMTPLFIINFSFQYVLVLSILIMPFVILYLWLWSYKIIINNSTQTIQHIKWFTSILSINFAEVGEIRFEDWAYRIFKYWEKFANGIMISSLWLNKSTKDDYEKNILPKIKDRIFTKQKEYIKDNISSDSLQHWKNHNWMYSYQIKNIRDTWFKILILLCVGWWTIISYKKVERLVIGCFIIFCLIIMIMTNFYKVIIDTYNHTITKQQIWLVSFLDTTYSLTTFQQYLVVKHRLNGIYTHTTVQMLFTNDKEKESSITLMTCYHRNSIDRLLDETTYIRSL